MPLQSSKSFYERLAELNALPDGWVFPGTNLTIGDMRQLVIENGELRGAKRDERRAEFLQTCVALVGRGLTLQQILESAEEMIDAVDEYVMKDPAPPSFTRIVCICTETLSDPACPVGFVVGNHEAGRVVEKQE